MANWMASLRTSSAVGVELIKGPFAFAPGFEHAGVLQQAQVGRDPGLAHARDLLQLVDGQLVRLQQRHDAQARGVGESAKDFESIVAWHFQISVDAVDKVYIFAS